MADTLVKTLTTNLRRIAALPLKQHPAEDKAFFRRLAPLPEEKGSAYRVRALKVIGNRWSYAGSTVRAGEDGNRPLKASEQFLTDLQEYGAAQFDENTGALIVESLGLGPSPSEYVLATASRKRKVRKSRPAARA